MPPAPSEARTSYEPMRVPAERLIWRSAGESRGLRQACKGPDRRRLCFQVRGGWGTREDYSRARRAIADQRPVEYPAVARAANQGSTMTVARSRTPRRAGDAMPELREARHLLEMAERAAVDGDLASADQLLRDAARIQEAELGPRHPDLANTLNNLAIVAEKAGRTSDAETFYRRAAAMLVRVASGGPSNGRGEPEEPRRLLQ